MGTDCIFCKLIRGEIPSFKVFEDAVTLAFMDINPLHEGHVLVIPKEHAPDIYSVSPPALQATVLTAQKIARAVHKALKPDGLNLVQANGPGAAQSVFHFHVHVLPRENRDDAKLNWGLNPGNMDAIRATADLIKQHLD